MATTKIITEVTDLNAASSTNGLKMPTGGAYSGTPTDGMVRNDTTGSSQGSASTMQHYNGTDWKNFENLSNTFTADFLVVAGGGSGGSHVGGGGGAGGLRTSWPGGSGGGQLSETSLSLSLATPYDVEVGPGGAATGSTNTNGNNGSNSVFFTTTSTGGGGGGTVISPGTDDGLSGGSGGGASGTASSSSPTAIGGAATSSPVQGYAGGSVGARSSTNTSGAGGGGAGAVGSSRPDASNSTAALGNGGDGVQIDITGTSYYFAGGGGAGAFAIVGGGDGGAGGGGGGSSTSATGGSGDTSSINNGGNGDSGGSKIGGAGALNSGGGGGGGAGSDPGGLGGAGGSGIVILRYPTADVSSFAVTGTLDTTTDTAYPIANTAYYKFNGDALDSSGNGYNGIASNLSPYAAGRFGQAAVFNGSSSYILANGLQSLYDNNQTSSISLWFKSTYSAAGQHIFIDYSGNFNYSIFLNTNGTITSLTRGPSGDNIFTSVGTYNDGNWHHVVISKNNATLQKTIYIDNNLLVTQSFFGTAWSTTPQVSFGCLFVPPSTVVDPFNGSIDQVRIFSSALTPANVTSLYNEGTVVESTDGTDSILQFIGGTGTVTFS